MRPSATATSASNAARPVPSTTLALRMTRSNMRLPPSLRRRRALIESAVKDLPRELVEERRPRWLLAPRRQQPIAEECHREHHADHATTGERHVDVVERDPALDESILGEPRKVVERALDRRASTTGFQHLGLEYARREERQEETAVRGSDRIEALEELPLPLVFGPLGQGLRELAEPVANELGHRLQCRLGEELRLRAEPAEQQHLGDTRARGDLARGRARVALLRERRPRGLENERVDLRGRTAGADLRDGLQDSK